MLEQKFKRSIIKSRPYFEEKYLCEGQLAAQKDTIIQIRYAVQRAKQEYSACLHRLEQISEEIHVQRQNNKLMVLTFFSNKNFFKKIININIFFNRNVRFKVRESPVLVLKFLLWSTAGKS